jgi:hypothetical protein
VLPRCRSGRSGRAPRVGSKSEGVAVAADDKISEDERGMPFLELGGISGPDDGAAECRVAESQIGLGCDLRHCDFCDSGSALRSPVR